MEGMSLGLDVGALDGDFDGYFEGLYVGYAEVGLSVVNEVGSTEGDCVGV